MDWWSVSVNYIENGIKKTSQDFLQSETNNKWLFLKDKFCHLIWTLVAVDNVFEVWGCAATTG